MKKNTFNYFDGFANLSKYSHKLATNLHDTLSNFDPSQITEQVKKAHDIEHSADHAKHDIMNRLVKEFLPPIESEDITSLTQEIDDVTDSIEDVLIFIDMFNIKSIRPEVLKFTELLVSCTKAMDKALEEFKSWKSSKKLHEYIIEVNRLEEIGDSLYIDIMRNLYHTSTDPIELLTWTEILQRLEKCADNCEDVANIIETIVMKNS